MKNRQIGFAQDSRHSFFLISITVLFISLFLYSVNGYANTLLSPKKHSHVWQQLITELSKDKGIFNRSLRESVREQLGLIELSDIEAVDADILKQRLLPRLQTLDKALSKYIRVSEKSKSFSQLKQLMPALLNIEERKLIERLLKQQNIRLPNLRNSRLMPFLDKRITRLANQMIFNMKALVRERRPYEPELLKAMAAYGIEFSARPPDFILEYDLDLEGANEKGEWVFKSHIAFLNAYHMPIVAVDELVVVEAAEESVAQEKATAVLAKLISMQLKIYLIKTAQKT